VHQTDGRVGSAHTSRLDDVRRVARWSAAATTLGDFPVSLLGPAAPANLLRARALVAAPASTAGPAGPVRRALTPMSSWFNRPATFVRPMVSTVDRPPVAPRVAAAGPIARRTSASMPALRSVADAVARAGHAPNPSAPAPTNAVINRAAGPASTVAGSVAHAPAPESRESGAGPLGHQNRAVTGARPGPMPSRLAEAPVPPLPLAAAFAARATTDGSREMLPLAARARTAAAARSRPAARMPSVLAAFNAPLVRRSRFGSAIAPATTASPFEFSRQSTLLRMPGSARTVESVGAPAAAVAAAITARAMTQPGSSGSTRPDRGAAPARGAAPFSTGTTSRREIRRSIDAPEPAMPMAPGRVTPRVPGIAAPSAGARFLAALNEGPVDPVRPVPAHFAPLARAIAGPRPVAVRSGPSTSRALRRAGKQAATVGNVVHLAASPVTAPPTSEVFAHELVHAARPSPIPRFFDDDRHSPEEDLARAAGNLMRAMQPPTIAGHGPDGVVRRQSPADSRTPTFGTAGLAVGASGGLMSALAGGSPSSPATPKPDSTVRRSPANRPAAQRRKARTTSTSSAPSRSSTASTGGSSTGSSSNGSMSPSTTIFRSAAGSGIVRRETAPSIAGPPGSSIFASGGPAGGNDNGNGAPSGLAALAANVGALGQSANTLSSSTSPADNELIERIIDAIEERVIAELERRGRRHHPGVF
jgi:hypothetical protein